MESQLLNNIIQKLQAIGFKINWTLLKIGYEGQDFLPKLISSNAISQYTECLVETMESDYELIVQLISPEDEMEFCEILEKLARDENVEQSIQQRKLRVYVVLEALETLPNDYFNGLLELTDTWVSLGLPDDCPHVVQGRNNTYTPQEYYTQDVFNSLLEKNKQWVRDEIEYIKSLEK
ncbi:MAG TPA: hypothetical protein DCP51_02160 [Clostridiales bacterium]|uniref:Uncharacterized protein n=1 Tax=Candidatus Uhrbacteria bacterium GW2011_GWF2_39_13 TaxID=1618995 RepID=A0A0G0MFB4_9BACT|nr:MAG: hypothetical protein UT30_C0051G0002 [Candidatus Uhrbacteria bacterium GW2011_GWF2_39_13]HAN20473.1 hypothetical protein [Clostridiales bacterium]